MGHGYGLIVDRTYIYNKDRAEYGTKTKKWLRQMSGIGLLVCVGEHKPESGNMAVSYRLIDS